MKDVELRLTFGHVSILKLNRAGEKYGLSTYEQIIKKLLSEGGGDSSKVKELERKLEKQKTLLNRLTNLLKGK
ncbi:MAG: hypothetical protein ABFS35_21895 [Bacteroidota bacterium]